MTFELFYLEMFVFDFKGFVEDDDWFLLQVHYEERLDYFFDGDRFVFFDWFWHVLRKPAAKSNISEVGFL